MSGPTTVKPFGGRDWMTEVTAILADTPSAPFVQKEHLLALVAAQAQLTKEAALMNRALVAIMVDNKLPELHFPGGLIEFVEQNQLDLAIDYVKRQALVIRLLRPLSKEKVM